MTKRMPLLVKMIFVVFLLLLSVIAAAAEVSSSFHPNGDDHGSNTIISIPLLPHAAVQRRYLQETGSSSSTTLPLVLKRPRHSKYHNTNYLENTNNKEYDVDDSRSNESSNRRRSILSTPPDPSQALQIAGLFQGYGTHYADLWCGSPPQRQTVIVDTGSGVTAFPCQECRNCGVPAYHIDPLFDESLSASFEKLVCGKCLRGNCDSSSNQCSISMSYQEGSSWSAYEAVDTCYVGGFHDRPVNAKTDNNVDGLNDLDPLDASSFAFDMKFGCQTRITGLFVQQLADGIMGMDVAPAAFWWQMYDARKIKNKAFSLCFARHEEAARTGTESGAMSLGGTDSRLHKTPMVYSAVTDSSGFFQVHVRKIYLREGGGGLSALSTDSGLKVLALDISESSINSGKIIVDSGTTDTYFSRRLSEPFGKVYTQLTGKTYDHTVKHFTAEELSNEPTILFQLSGNEDLNQAVNDQSTTNSPVAGLAGDLDPDHPFDLILAIPPEHYYEYDSESNGYISRFYVDESSGGVLGANAMMGHDVYFDVEKSHIGWAEATCDYTTLVKTYTNNKDWTPSPPDDLDPSRFEPVKPFSGTDDAEQNGSDDESEGGGEPSDNYGDTNSSSHAGVCSGIACQATILGCMLVGIIFVAQKLIRRPASYDDLSGSELELQNVDDDRDGTYT